MKKVKQTKIVKVNKISAEGLRVLLLSGYTVVLTGGGK